MHIPLNHTGSHLPNHPLICINIPECWTLTMYQRQWYFQMVIIASWDKWESDSDGQGSISAVGLTRWDKFGQGSRRAWHIKQRAMESRLPITRFLGQSQFYILSLVLNTFMSFNLWFVKYGHQTDGPVWSSPGCQGFFPQYGPRLGSL